MRDYPLFVPAKLKTGKENQLLEAIQDGSLGAGSIAGGEYIQDMNQLVQQSWVQLLNYLKVVYILRVTRLALHCYYPEPVHPNLPLYDYNVPYPY